MRALGEWHRAVKRARERISEHVARTPIVWSDPLTRSLGWPVWFKCEQFQPMGAFKIRGAANALLTRQAEGALLGAVTYSTGNHGLAVAYLGAKLNIPVAICISQAVPANKVNALRARGAEIVIEGQSQDDAQSAAVRIAEERGYALIEPFDDPDIIAGQGTMAAEMLDQVPDMETMVVPVSGGGLAAGVAAEIKAVRPAIRVVGVSMEGGAVMYESLKRGHPVKMPESSTLADSLQGGIGLDNRWTLKMLGDYLDDLVLVSEAEIAWAMGFLSVEQGMIVEGAAAVTAAWMLRRPQVSGPVAGILTGRNVDGLVAAELMTAYSRPRA